MEMNMIKVHFIYMYIYICMQITMQHTKTVKKGGYKRVIEVVNLIIVHYMHYGNIIMKFHCIINMW
jgi:hypothetical protein